MTQPIPRSQVAPINPRTGHFVSEWWNYLNSLSATTTSEAVELPEYKLVGPSSVVVSGLLQNGLASLALKNDQLAPDPTSYYGTDDEGAKGWRLLAEAFDVTADLSKSVDGTTNAITFGLADLADAGGGSFKLLTRDAKGRLSGTSSGDAADVPYDNTSSGLSATDVQAAIDEVAASGGGSGAMTLVGTATVAGSAATTLTLSSLDLASDGRYIVEIALENPTGSTASISLYYNSDTTATNYDSQFVTGNNTVAGGRANSGLFTTVVAGECTTTTGKIVHDRDGRATALLNTVRGPSATLALQMFAHYWRTVSNVTGITISSSVASSLAVGSYLKVWKIT